MKKVLFFAAVAATVLATGCSKENGTQPGGDANAIEFRGVVDKTRATTVGATAELTNFFVHAGTHVIGYSIGNIDFMSASVYKDGTTWTYAPEKYYPSNGDVVNFYAYSPVKDVNMTKDVYATGNDDVSFNYAVPADQSVDNTAVDLLVSKVSDKTADGTPVAFTFDHALSAATFSAANREDVASELTYVIHDISLTNLHNEGAFYYRADLWTNHGSTTTFIAGIPEAGVALQAIGATAPAQKLLSANDIMILMPQQYITLGTLEADGITVDVDGVFVEVTYSLKDGAGVPIFANAVRRLTLPAGFEIRAGQLYNFEFEFGGTSGAGTTAIEFTVTEVNDWEEVPATELPQ